MAPPPPATSAMFNMPVVVCVAQKSDGHMDQCWSWHRKSNSLRVSANQGSCLSYVGTILTGEHTSAGLSSM